MDKCPNCSSVHRVGIEVRGFYDGVLYWKCKECGKCYHRWDEAWQALRSKAEEHMSGRSPKWGPKKDKDERAIRPDQPEEE